MTGIEPIQKRPDITRKIRQFRPKVEAFKAIARFVVPHAYGVVKIWGGRYLGATQQLMLRSMNISFAVVRRPNNVGVMRSAATSIVGVLL